MQNAKCKMQNAKCKMQDARCKMQNAKEGIVRALHFAFCILHSIDPAAQPRAGADLSGVGRM
ncbi:MAG: hypothetical protein WCF99_18160, partial [Chloroflexales bacterium]